MTALRQELAALQQRTAAVEADAAKLEGAIRVASTAAAPPPRRLTDDRARMDGAQKRGQQLIRDGDPQAALEIYVAAYRDLTSRGGVEKTTASVHFPSRDTSQGEPSPRRTTGEPSVLRMHTA